MSSNDVGVTPVVDSGLFTSVSFSAASTSVGRITRAIRSPATAATPAAAAPAINARRFIYVCFGVISDEGISLFVRINMSP